MADVKISALPAATTPLAGTEVLPIVQGGTTDQVSVANLTAGRDVAANSVNASGSLNFVGAARRITGDMSNATVSSRVFVQNSTANSTTLFALMPNGTGISSRLQCFNSSNPDSGTNSLFDAGVVGTTDVRLQSTYQASGTPLPMTFYAGGAERMRISTSGSVIAGGSAALATTATDGFLYVPTCAGVPTGTPTAVTGMAPIVVNTTNNKLYFYSGGAWRDAGP